MNNAQPQLATEDGLFQLSGAEPIWIWAHTCPKPTCRCRQVLILATTEGREVLQRHIAELQLAWNSGTAYATAAAARQGVDAFKIDLDSVRALPLLPDHPLDLTAHSRVSVILGLIDGEVLDSIGRLFFRGIGKPDPETRLRDANKVEIKGWLRNEMLAFDDILGVRKDLYLVGPKKYEAIENYCANPTCSCGEVIVDFEQTQARRPTSIGRVVIPLSGSPRIEPDPGQFAILDELWTAFKRRHPRRRERFARRNALLKEVGSRSSPAPEPARTATAATLGRNDPCPCGSAKKNKKCCAATAATAGAGS